MPNTTFEKWEEKSIKQLAVLICDGDWIETKNQSFNGIRLIQTGNIGEGCYKDKTENARYISEETFKKLNCTEIFSGDCLVSRLPQPLGRACIIPYKNERMITAVDCSIIRFNNKVITPKYFIYYSMSDSYNKKVTALSTGATRQRISRKNLETITIPLPPLPEQERIVAKLDKAFEAIDKSKTIAETNLKNAKELFESALNKAFTKNTDGWEEKTLGEVSQIISGTTPDTSNPDFWGKGNYWVTPAEINEDNLYIRKTAREITNLAIESCSLCKMPRGTIIFSSRAPIGKIAISDVDTLYCNQGFKNFICSKNIYNKFLYYFLLKNKKYLISLGKGTTFKEVSKGIISAVNIQYPLLPEQHKIVERLDKLQEQTKQLEAIYTKKIKDLDELKQSILQKAFRGEL